VKAYLLSAYVRWLHWCVMPTGSR